MLVPGCDSDVYDGERSTHIRLCLRAAFFSDHRPSTPPLNPSTPFPHAANNKSSKVGPGVPRKMSKLHGATCIHCPLLLPITAPSWPSLLYIPVSLVWRHSPRLVAEMRRTLLVPTFRWHLSKTGACSDRHTIQSYNVDSVPFHSAAHTNSNPSSIILLSCIFLHKWMNVPNKDDPDVAKHRWRFLCVCPAITQR